MKVNAIIERSNDGFYSIFTVEEFESFALLGYGKTPEEAKKDFWDAYAEIKEMLKEENKEVPDLEVTFKYDVASFLKSFHKKLSLSGLEMITGINQRQLQRYMAGTRKPSATTVQKIEQGVHEFADSLSELEFA